MKNTEAVRAAFSQMQRQAENLGAGYKIEPRVSPDGEHITIIIHRPKDSAKAVYPDVMFHDDWYGKEIVRFSIHPTGYGEESLDRARQMAHGLLTACELVNRCTPLPRTPGWKPCLSCANTRARWSPPTGARIAPIPKGF